MAKSRDDKLESKRRALVQRTASIVRVSEDEANRLLSLPRQQSLRINTLKAGTDVVDKLKDLGWHGSQYQWFADGYTVDSGLELVRDSALVADGQIYIQNAASWLPVIVLDPQPGESILDVCAAPGGKTSHIAAAVSNRATITANDNSRPRLAKLKANLSRLGAVDVEYTLIDASQLTRRLDGHTFDKILLDAPCSGEGMMRFDRDKDFETWSVAQIKRLHQLQKRLLSQSWQLLKPGGTLVYSTCTMAPEEDESVIDYLLRKNEDAEVVSIDVDLPNRVAALTSWNDKQFHPSIAGALRLKPSKEIEAFFVCKLQKA